MRYINLIFTYLLTTYRARLVLVVYLKPEAENTRNLTNKTA